MFLKAVIFHQAQLKRTTFTPQTTIRFDDRCEEESVESYNFRQTVIRLDWRNDSLNRCFAEIVTDVTSHDDDVLRTIGRYFVRTYKLRKFYCVNVSAKAVEFYVDPLTRNRFVVCNEKKLNLAISRARYIRSDRLRINGILNEPLSNEIYERAYLIFAVCAILETINLTKLRDLSSVQTLDIRITCRKD